MAMRTVTFEYLAGKKISGTILEVFPDGTLLVTPDAIPEEWRGDNPEQKVPFCFHVDPRAFLLSDSETGKEYRAYERMVTALPNTKWRNLPASLAAKGLEFYDKALQAAPRFNASCNSRIRYFEKSSKSSDAIDGFEYSAAPGRFIMIARHHKNPDILFLSCEGWPDRASGNPDPRWQSVYLLDVKDPDNYKILRYPLPASSYQPEGEECLYGHSGFFSEDGRFFYAVLYGFEEEGGGLWVVDTQKKNFWEDNEAFSQIFSWDHALTFLIMPKFEGSPYNTVIMTGKEVKDDFAMTLNALKISFDGLESELIGKERLVRMIGWNPVPFAYEWTSPEEILVYVETYFNFESEVVPRVKNVYAVPLKLS